MDAKLEAGHLLSIIVTHTIHYFLNKILINLMENNVVISFIKSEIISSLSNDKTEDRSKQYSANRSTGGKGEHSTNMKLEH